jgi:hypothetical protein
VCFNPEEILTREAQASGNVTFFGQKSEENQLRQLSLALKQQLIHEIREEKI